MTEYCIKAETKGGKVRTLRRGFISQGAAEDHPIHLSLWKRVWVERWDPPTLPVQEAKRLTGQEHLELTFDAILAAATSGKRCPENGTHNVTSLRCAKLAADGRIKIEVFARNFRVVTILTGPHAGKKTAPAPYKVRHPKIIITQSGKRLIKMFGDDVRVIEQSTG